MSRLVCTVLFHGQNVTHGILQCSPTLNIYTGFITAQLITNTSGCC